MKGNTKLNAAGNAHVVGRQLSLLNKGQVSTRKFVGRNSVKGGYLHEKETSASRAKPRAEEKCSGQHNPPTHEALLPQTAYASNLISAYGLIPSKGAHFALNDQQGFLDRTCLERYCDNG